MKCYLKPNIVVEKLSSGALLQSLSNGEAAQGSAGDGNGVNFGKEGMTPVSEDNASSIWED